MVQGVKEVMRIIGYRQGGKRGMFHKYNGVANEVGIVSICEGPIAMGNIWYDPRSHKRL